jgi:nucleotide-binding universal stress UspA family protein
VARTLVVGYDGSEGSKSALDAALEMAREDGYAVVVAYGYEPPGRGEEKRAHRAVVRERGEQVTAEAVERAATAGVEVEVAMLPERPTEALVGLAEEHDARAIVIGSLGDTTITGRLLGVNARRLIRRSRRPVLVVPSGEG